MHLLCWFWPVNCIEIGGHVALLRGPTVCSIYCDWSILHVNDESITVCWFQMAKSTHVNVSVFTGVSIL